METDNPTAGRTIDAEAAFNKIHRKGFSAQSHFSGCHSVESFPLEPTFDLMPLRRCLISPAFTSIVVAPLSHC